MAREVCYIIADSSMRVISATTKHDIDRCNPALFIIFFNISVWGEPDDEPTAVAGDCFHELCGWQDLGGLFIGYCLLFSPAFLAHTYD